MSKRTASSVGSQLTSSIRAIVLLLALASVTTAGAVLLYEHHLGLAENRDSARSWGDTTKAWYRNTRGLAAGLWLWSLVQAVRCSRLWARASDNERRRARVHALLVAGISLATIALLTWFSLTHEVLSIRDSWNRDDPVRGLRR